MLAHDNCDVNIALLAPVPREHLDSALNTVQKVAKVAFGSRKWDVFDKLDKKREGKPVNVYIYESYGDGQYDFRVSWHARYLGKLEAVNGAHPNKDFRPDSTAKYPGDNEGGDWVLFWEVDSLQKLPELERVHVGTFAAYGKKKPYGNSFAPRGPLLVNQP